MIEISYGGLRRVFKRAYELIIYSNANRAPWVWIVDVFGMEVACG